MRRRNVRRVDPRGTGLGPLAPRGFGLGAVPVGRVATGRCRVFRASGASGVGKVGKAERVGQRRVGGRGSERVAVAVLLRRVGGGVRRRVQGGEARRVRESGGNAAERRALLRGNQREEPAAARVPAAQGRNRVGAVAGVVSGGVDAAEGAGGEEKHGR